MRARPQPRKPSTDEVEAHMIDLHPFRPRCDYCVMAAARSDHQRRQAEDYNEVPVITCDYGFFTDLKDDNRQLTEAEAIAVGATPIFVIRDRRSKMIHADAVRCEGIEDEFPIETETKWILGLGCPEVIIRTDGERSIVALGRRVGEHLREVGVKANAKHKPSVRQQISRTRREWCQNCEREGLYGGSIRTRTARCDSREITCFNYSSNNQQITPCSTVPRRCVRKGVLPGAVQEKDPS